MAYQDHVKIKAYTLFINGTSFEEIAKTLSKSFKIAITANTIKNWSEKKDRKGLSWADYRTDIREVAKQTIDAQEKNRIVAARDKVDTLTEKLYTRLVEESAMKVSSYDGGMYALRTFLDFGIKLDEKTQGKTDGLAIIQMVLDIFYEVPEVRKSIQKHWKHIEKEIRIRILHENPDLESQKMIEG